MIINFATCNKKTALGYLQAVYPTETITEDRVSKLLDLVDKDIVRVQDPLMYGNRIQVIQGNNYQPENMKEINEAIDQLKNSNLL